MHTADGNLLIDQGTSAGTLTGSGAGQTQNIGKWQHLFNQARRLFHRALGDQLQIAGDVDMGGTIHLAGGLTVGIVVREHELQVGASEMK